MLKEIQYLRAIAVLMVICVHAAFVKEVFGFSPYFDFMGRAGVDIFFVISGYVVSASLLKMLKVDEKAGFIANLENNVARLKAFFVKRIFRLFPIVFLLVAANIACITIVPNSISHTSVTEEVMGLFSHITLQSDMDTIIFTQKQAQIRTINHFWSLADEERFYIFTPLLILLCASTRRFMGLCAAIIIGLGILKALYPFPEEVMYLSGFLRFDSFMFGIIVYLLQSQTKVMNLIFAKKHSLFTMNAISILLIVIAARLPMSKVEGDILLPFHGSAYYYVAIYTISSILIALASQDKGYMLGIPGLKTVLFWIGEKSYTIYVFQFFFIGIANKIATLSGYQNEIYPTTIIFACVVFVLSEAIYRLWEKPLRTKGRDIAKNIMAEAGVVTASA